MARTHHHSRKWGSRHRWADRLDRAGHSGCRDAGEAPSWHVRLHDERPGRRADGMTMLRLMKAELDPDAVCFIRGRGRKPHTWYW